MPAPVEVREGSEGFLVVNALSTRSGGLTRAVLQRVRLLDAQGIRTTLLVLEYRHGEDGERLLLRLRRAVPRRTRVRYFWREGGSVFPGDLGDVRPTAPRARTLRDPIGRVRRVETVDSEGRTTVEHRSVRGRRVAIDSPGDGQAMRYYLEGRRSWMAVRDHLAVLGAHAIVADAAGPLETTLAAAQGRWVAQVLRGSRGTPVLFVDGTQACLLPTTMDPGSARVVSTLHNPHTTSPWTPQAPSATHWDAVLRRTGAITRVVVLTQAQREDVRARYGEPAPTVVNNCVTGSPSPSARRQPRLVVIGRLTRQKRVEHAIQAFAAYVAPQVPEARLDIVGDGARRAALGELSAQLGVADRVVFHGFRHDVRRFLARSVACVQTSRFEGMPLVLLEAMQSGTPCIAYGACYGPAELIRHGIDGLLVPPGDLEALGAAMVDLLTHRDRAAELGAAARDVTTRFSPERYAEEWLQIYLEEVAAGRDR